MAPPGIRFETPATTDNFDEAAYLAANPDVAADVRPGRWKSGRDHFESCGRKEGRALRFPEAASQTRRDKIERVRPLLRLDMPHVRRGEKYDFLTEELRKEAGLPDTEVAAGNPYDRRVEQLIEAHPDGLLLDCGAGRRDVYYENVVNFEIFDCESTDILGIGEALPFKDASFDAVISLAVLEHVRDPFKCAHEIVRVLKPGGRLICSVPFLQPLHGYPHHYYNMTGQGLRALFDRALVIDDHMVLLSTLPVWSLTWIVRSWAEGLPERTREQFLSLRLNDIAVDPVQLLEQPWVRDLPEAKNFELASATMLFAHKPESAGS
jgi:SAM-dependent methyltransferase